ncbi:hypothetical protein OAC86_01185 [bacterium]|nr:hypothetical protein [bacterium]MDB9900138.1 hypothetical protein [bacterium]
MKKSKPRRSNNRSLTAMKCMNSNPEESKWGQFAPAGGCDEVVMVDDNVDRVLCSYCTTRSTNIKIK